MLKKPRQTKHSKYHKGRISYNYKFRFPSVNNTGGTADRENPRMRPTDKLKVAQTTTSSLSMLSRPGETRPLRGDRQVVGDSCKANERAGLSPNLGLVSLEPARLTAGQIAAAELAIKRKIKKEGTLYTRVFPHMPVTKKPLEVRMGKGKGSVSYWMTRIRPGTFLFELTCSNPELAKLAFTVASSKLPFRTGITQVKK